ncbi:hypothetical protein E1301_Tti014508 [Triplophysa tibetana]|uniref:Uncharacterized protein n=1 Tax=Triplophysa tibetana TaxID=1572043 RepID=A0A5A9PMN8_9TELE|nr:hypothetical protein E1301_Tti014508 [Triplophysa tibetana]
MFLQVQDQFEGSFYNGDGRNLSNQNCFQIRSKTNKWPLGHSLDWFAVLSSMKTAGQKHLKLSLWCSAGQGETDVSGRDLPAFPLDLVDSGGIDIPPQLSSALWESLSLLYSDARKDSSPKAQCECQYPSMLTTVTANHPETHHHTKSNPAEKNAREGKLGAAKGSEVKVQIKSSQEVHPLQALVKAFRRALFNGPGSH